MLIHGNVTPVTAGSPVEWLRHSLDQEADDWSDLLDRYLEGWAENNLGQNLFGDGARILFSTIHTWDSSRAGPFRCTSKGFGQEFASVGGYTAWDLGFFLHGSTDRPRSCGQLTFFREAPRLGLTGVTTITIGEHGVVAEAVAYDLNPALDVLRGRPTTLVCGLK